MSLLIAQPDKTWTAADLARRFGPMPLWRFGFDPLPGAATEDDVDRWETQHDLLYELIDGVLVRKAMGSFESVIAMEIAAMLMYFVKPRKLGWVLGADGMLRLWPGRIRIPDVSFIARTQTPDGKFPRKPRIASLFPDLAVEVLSESNTADEMAEKRSDYFQSGTRLVWIIDPETKTAEVYTGVDQHQTIPADGILTAEPVLPGLTIPLSTIFDA